MPERLRRARAAATVAASIAVLAACGGAGGPYGAPVVERSTTSAAAAPAVAEPADAPTAAEDPGTSDWEATVRPLGESGTTRTRRLGDAAPPAAPAGPEGEAGAVPGEAPGGASDANPAVVSLLNTATAKTREGDYVAAAATLERALNIEPDNPWLWHRLADVRLREGDLDQAASLASKSNSLALGDNRLQADNWKLIAEVRRRQGATAAAATAEAQAASLLRAQQ